MTHSLSAVRELFATLDARRRPEDVAQMVLELIGHRLSRRQRLTLERAAKGAVKRKLIAFTSMLEDFARPAGMEKQVRTAESLFATACHLSAAQCCEPDTIETFVRTLAIEVRKTFGHSDFVRDRLNRAARREAGLELSRRRYNKLFRHLARMEQKLDKLVRELKKLELTKIGKSQLASKLGWEDFSADVDAACFVAYYAARCNLRSEFTISGQTRPFDDIAHMLFERCEGSQAGWWAMAHVYPVRQVLVHLSDEQKGELMGRWYEVLGDIAELLREVWSRSSFRRDSMVVKSGDDSTTWNNAANAWNKARAAWMGLLFSMGMASVLDAVCPGKVLRLMAADVVAWHRCAGGQLNPDTAVWSELPLPWQVLEGQVPCRREDVQRVCRRHGVDADKGGWTSPPKAHRAVPFTATPELVHGVSVASPALANTLRRAGWFSGKSARAIDGGVVVDTDSYGFAIGAEPAPAEVAAVDIERQGGRWKN